MTSIDETSVAPDDGSADSVLKVAQELKAGTLSVDDAEPRLAAITASSNLHPPITSADKAFADEASDSWMKPSDDNNPNRLFEAGLTSSQDFTRLYRALVGGPAAPDAGQETDGVSGGAPKPGDSHGDGSVAGP